MKLVLILAACLALGGAAEWQLHRRTLNKVPVRILVNGTRGKTSVTRMMAGALREAGLTVYAKSTGSEAAVILPDGGEEILARRRGARLTEQIAFFRRAVRGGAGAVVVECMAVLPESQKVMAEKLVCPTMVLITNARVDHVAEMGATREDTVRALSFSIPRGARVISQEERFSRYAARFTAPETALPQGALEGFSYPVYEENVRLVLAACQALGVDAQTALRGMRRAAPDIGMAGPFRRGDAVVINAFAANDLDSTRGLWEKARDAQGEKLPVRVLYNNRTDREYRLAEFVPLMRALAGEGATLTAIGDHPRKVLAFYRRRAKMPATAPQDAQALLGERALILCMGNIKGAGRAFIGQFLDGGRA